MFKKNLVVTRNYIAAKYNGMEQCQDKIDLLYLTETLADGSVRKWRGSPVRLSDHTENPIVIDKDTACTQRILDQKHFERSFKASERIRIVCVFFFQNGYDELISTYKIIWVI